MKTIRSNHCKRIAPIITAIMALAMLMPFGTRANGTAYYFDVNGTNAGFGSPSGSYTNNGPWWSTDATGVAAPAALSSGRQMTFGAANSDFNGNTFTVNLTNINWVGLLINSTNANITFVGTGNGYVNGGSTWTVTSGSTLTEAVLFNGYGLNFNNENITLIGGGTINFASCVGYNDTATINQNMPGGTVNLGFAWSAGTANQANYTLTDGSLNFINVASANTFNGLHSGKLFSINGGTIDNTSGSPMSLGLGAGTFTIGGDFTFNGSSDLTLGPAALSLGTFPHQITVNAHTLTFGGVVFGSGGGITLTGAGTLALTNANTYTGDTTLSGGTLDLKNQNAAQNSTMTLNGGTLVLDSSVSANAFTFGGLAASASGVGYDLALQNNVGTPIALIVGGNGAATTYAGVLSGAGSLTMTGAGYLTLGHANTFTGNTTISGGTLDLSDPNALQNSTVTMTGGTASLMFDGSVSGNAFTLGGLATSASGTGYDIGLQNNYNSAGIALTVGGNNANTTYAGNLTDSGRAGSLTKIGTGTLSLAGVNTYSGPTTVQNGQFAGVVGGSCASSAVTVAATAGNNAALGVFVVDNTKQWSCPSLVVNNGGISSGLQFTFGSSVIPSTVTAPLNISSSVTFSTPPVVSIVAASLPVTSGNGYPLMTWGSGSAPSLSGVNLVLPTRTLGSLSIVGSTLYLQVSGTTEPASWTGGSGVWDINDSDNLIWQDAASTSTYYQQGVSGDSVVFDNTAGSGGTVTLNTNVLPVNVLVNTTTAYTITGSGSIGGTTPLTKTGAGTLTLATANAYGGGTTLLAGQLNINNGGSSAANSAIGNGPLTIAGPSTIDNTSAADVALQPAITQTWNADFTYAGSVHSLNLGAGPVALGGNRQITVSGNTLTVGGVIGDANQYYGLTKAGAGTLTLGNVNTYTGPTTISVGFVNVNVAGALGASGTTTVNGTLNLNAGAVNYPGLANSLSGTGTVNFILGTGSAATFLNGDNSGFNGVLNIGVNAAPGAGKLQLNGVLGSTALVNVLTNATVYVSGVSQPAAITLDGGVTGENLGQLRLDAGATWSGPVTLAGNTTGTFQGTVGCNSGISTISGNIGETGGSWTLSKAGGGTLVLSGTNAFSGGLLVEQGAVTLYNDQSQAAGGLAVGTDNYNGCTLNIGDASQSAPTIASVASGQAVQVGALVSGNTGFEVVSAVGADGFPTVVTNNGSLIAGRNSSVIVGNDAIWVQNGLVNAQPYGGYAAAINVNNGGSFIFTGTNAIQLTENPGTTSVSSFNIGNATTTGGTFTTGQPFYYNSNSAAAGVGRITMAGGGTLSLATNIPQLTTGDSSGQFQLGNGGGVINLNGFNTTLSLGINNLSGQSGGLTITGPGTLTLTGTNTYTGDTTVSGGTLDVANQLAVESSTLTMSGGKLVFDRAVAGNAFLFGGLAAGTSGPGYDLALTNNAGAPVALTVGNNIYGATTYAGVLSGPGSLTQAGTGMLTLSGANIYTGNTTVNAGTLEIVNPTIATNSIVTVAGGAMLQLDFAVTNQVGGLVFNGVSQTPGVYNNATSSSYISGPGSLLVVPGIATNPTNLTFSVSGNTLELSWPADHLGWLVQSNSVNLAVPADWHDLANSAAGTNYSITIDATKPSVFYRLRKP